LDPRSSADAFRRLLELTSTLRSPDGCAWDRAQTVSTIRPHLVEEFHELLEALDADDNAALRDEMGDILFLVVFLGAMAEDEGRFTLEQTIEGIDAKLRRRHPHVFGDEKADTPDEVRSRWESGKLEDETHAARESVLDGLPRDLPALLAARRLQEKAGAVGFDWEKMEDVLAKLREETDELALEVAAGDRERCEQEIGDLLFSVVNVARSLSIDPEAALRKTSLRFRRRFALIEERFRGSDLRKVGLAEMDRVWEEAKRRERDEDQRGR
jgi:MazG family protein